MWRRIGPWLTPLLVAVEVVLVWSGVLSLLDAVIVAVVVEALLAVTVIGRTVAAVRSFRTGRSCGRDGWTAAEDACAEVLPRPAARVILIEARMWVCLVRWLGRRRPTGVTFTYGRNVAPLMRIVLALVVVEGVIVEAVLATVLGHAGPWVWIALGLHLYGLVWIGGFLGSLRVVPHEVGDRTVRLRDSVFATIDVPLDGIAWAAPNRRGHTGRSGFTVDADGSALLAYGDTSVRLVLRSDADVHVGIAPAPAGLRTIDVSTDAPDALVRAIRSRLATVPGTTPPHSDQ
jgi:hypothetical protein